MSREELKDEIRKRLNSEEGEYTPPSIDEDICQSCGSVIEKNPFTKEYPEHGTDEVSEVMYCDSSCHSDHIEELKDF